MLSSKLSWLITAAITAALLSPTTIEAQTPSCASQLVPCAAFLNSTKPPASCCDPLREAVTKDLQCLCKLYENPALLISLGINVTQAIELPKYCNIPGDVSACKGRIYLFFSSNPRWLELGLNWSWYRCFTWNEAKFLLQIWNFPFLVFCSSYLLCWVFRKKNKSGNGREFCLINNWGFKYFFCNLLLSLLI